MIPTRPFYQDLAFWHALAGVVLALTLIWLPKEVKEQHGAEIGATVALFASAGILPARQRTDSKLAFGPADEEK